MIISTNLFSLEDKAVAVCKIWKYGADQRFYQLRYLV